MFRFESQISRRDDLENHPRCRYERGQCRKSISTFSFAADYTSLRFSLSLPCPPFLCPGGQLFNGADAILSGVPARKHPKGLPFDHPPISRNYYSRLRDSTDHSSVIEQWAFHGRERSRSLSLRWNLDLWWKRCAFKRCAGCCLARGNGENLSGELFASGLSVLPSSRRTEEKEKEKKKKKGRKGRTGRSRSLLSAASVHFDALVTCPRRARAGSR